MSGLLYTVAWRGRDVTIRAFDPAEHPTQAQAAHGNYSKREAWELAQQHANSHPKHYDPMQRKARAVVFVDVDGTTRVVKTIEQAQKPVKPEHHYTVTLKIRRTGDEVTTVEQGSNKREATDAARAKITVGATTLVRCTKGERVEAQLAAPAASTPAPAISPVPTTTQKGALPWE